MTIIFFIVWIGLALWWSWRTLPLEAGRMAWEREQLKKPPYSGLCGPL